MSSRRRAETASQLSLGIWLSPTKRTGFATYIKKTGNARAKNINAALGGRKKLLLTATPIAELRLRNFCVHTLRQDVSDTGYIKFTKRQVLTRLYTPGDTEQKLYYDRMSEYPQRDHIRALPDNGRQLVTMVIRKLLASSSAAVSKTLQSLINKLEALQEGYDDNLEGDLFEDFEAYSEYSEEYSDEDETDDDAFNEGRRRDRQEIIAGGTAHRALPSLRAEI
ncbi:MAG: hypothetical protein LBC56_07735 [Oscillospiraceae bacterium]|jgi:hypothetical protein|nr:hypothetical protein [Oscillospiraceae bacterium]